MTQKIKTTKTHQTNKHQVAHQLVETAEKFGAKYCAVEIADSVLSICKKDRGKDVSNLELQKLLFYCQAWHMAFYRELLFSDPIEAWEHGPIIRAVYHKFRDYKRLEPIKVPDSIPQLDDKALLTINKVLNRYENEIGDGILLSSSLGTMWLEPKDGLIDHELWHTEAEPCEWQTYYSILMPEIDRNLLGDINPNDYNAVGFIGGNVTEINVEEKYFMFFSAIPRPGETFKCTFDIDMLDALEAELGNEKHTYIFGCFFYQKGILFPEKTYARSIGSLHSKGLFIHTPISHGGEKNSPKVIPRKGEPGYKTVEERLEEGRSIRLGEFIE